MGEGLKQNTVPVLAQMIVQRLVAGWASLGMRDVAKAKLHAMIPVTSNNQCDRVIPGRILGQGSRVIVIL